MNIETLKTLFREREENFAAVGPYRYLLDVVLRAVPQESKPMDAAARLLVDSAASIFSQLGYSKTDFLEWASAGFDLYDHVMRISKEETESLQEARAQAKQVGEALLREGDKS